MTMMTPMGRGGRMYPRQRRWPRVLAVLLVIAVFAAAGFGAYWWFSIREDSSESAMPQTTKVCTTPTAKRPKSIPSPRQVEVDVANGTEQSGLAIDTADQLTMRGFMIVGIGNTEHPVREGVALVRYAKPQYAAAIRVAAYAPGAELVEVDKMKSGAVQLWIGPDFGRIASKKDADVTAVAMPVGEPRCRSKESRLDG